MFKKIIPVVFALLASTVTTVYAAQVLFTPSLFVSESHTDNVDLSADNEEESFITTAGMSLSGNVLWKTAGIELTYSPSYSKFDEDFEEYDSWRHSASLLAWKELLRNTRLELHNTYLRSNDPQDQSDDANASDPTIGPSIETDRNRRGRDEYYTNVAELRLTHQFGASDSLYAAYQYSILRDVDKEAGQPVDDNDIRTASAGLAYSFTTKWTVELDGAFADSDYVDSTNRKEYNGSFRLLHNFNRTYSAFVAYRHTVLDNEEDTVEDYKIYQPSIGIEMTFQENAGITIGLAHYTQDYETSEDKTGFNVNSDIYKTWNYKSGYFGITGSSGYEIDDDSSTDNGLTIYYAGRIQAGYQFTSRLSSSIYSSARNDEYIDETPDRTVTTIGAGIGFNWQALQWMTIGLSYDYSSVISDDATEEYTENSAMISIRVAPTSPYRLN